MYAVSLLLLFLELYCLTIIMWNLPNAMHHEVTWISKYSRLDPRKPKSRHHFTDIFFNNLPVNICLVDGIWLWGISWSNLYNFIMIYRLFHLYICLFFLSFLYNILVFWCQHSIKRSFYKILNLSFIFKFIIFHCCHSNF